MNTLTTKQRETDCRNGHPGSESVWNGQVWRCRTCDRANSQARRDREKLRRELERLPVEPLTEAYLIADEFADRLRECRKLQGTQADVAMAAGVNAWTLQHRERNLKRNLRIITAYADSIGVRVEYGIKLQVDTDE